MVKKCLKSVSPVTNYENLQTPSATSSVLRSRLERFLSIQVMKEIPLVKMCRKMEWLCRIPGTSDSFLQEVGWDCTQKQNIAGCYVTGNLESRFQYRVHISFEANSLFVTFNLTS